MCPPLPSPYLPLVPAAAVWATVLSGLVSLAVVSVARRRGTQPNLAGWMVGPALGVLWLTLSCNLPWQPGSTAVLEVRSQLFAQWLFLPLLELGRGLVGVGLVLVLSALTRCARAAGQMPRLALLGALTVCAGGVAECTRLVLHAWWRNDFGQANWVWGVREHLLWAALFGCLAMARTGRVRGSPAVEWRAAALWALGLVCLVALVVRTGWALTLVSPAPASLLSPPTCPSPHCTAGAPWWVEPAPYPRFSPDLGVLEATLPVR
jgi:hypothetical protein